MFEFVSNVIFFIILSTICLVALDYLFGTEKFKNLREMYLKNIPLVFSTVLFLVFGAIYWLLDYSGNDTMKGLFIFYQSCFWVGWWMYYTLYYIGIGVVNFRTYCLYKRKQPH